MIVREIKDHPELMNDFDWFNNYKDTRMYIRYECPELLEAFDKGNDKFWEERAKEFNKGKN